VRRSFVLALLALAPVPAAWGQELVVRIPVTGTIENGLAPFVARALKEAARANASAAILDLDTPGGRVDAAERIVDAVRASPIPVYAFVNPRAFSAGAFIALAANGIYMTPGGVLGAATPVDGAGNKAPEKYVSAMRAEFRALAEARGLDPRIAEAMVDETLEVPNLKPAGKLLTLSTGEAISVGFAKGEVNDITALLAAVGLPGATVMQISPNWAELLVRFLTNPVVSPLLLSLGMLGLLFEIKAGAFGLGGLVSLTALGLFFGSHLLLGLAAVIVKNELVDYEFVREKTHDFEVLRETLAAVDVDEMARRSGIDPAALVETAAGFARAESAAIVSNMSRRA